MILPVTENGGWMTRNIYQAALCRQSLAPDDLQGVEKPAHCGTLREKLRLEIHSLCTRTHCQEPLHCAQFSQHNATS